MKLARAHADPLMLPVIGQRAHAGFPSPADDWIEDTIDLNAILVANPVATFLWRVAGDCMVDTRIFHNDVIVVDPSLSPRHRSIVLAVVDGDPTVKCFLRRKGETLLVNENRNLLPFEHHQADIQTWGVVTWTLRNVIP